MHAKPLPRLAAALAGIAATAVALAQSPIDPVLVENASVQIRRSDYERELERLPAELRAGFASNERRVSDLLRRLLIERTLAAQARAEKLPEKPEYAGRLAAETEKLIAQFKVAEVERNAGAEFDARRASFEARARELYVADRSKYVTPEQVSASHILFETKTRSKEEAEKLAREALAKVKAGADFNKLAREVSEDRSAKTNNGQLGWFTRAEMDPAFADAAFALKQSGDLAAPVLSSFGWHVIRLEDVRPLQMPAFEQLKPRIMQQLTQRKIENMVRDLRAKAKVQ